MSSVHRDGAAASRENRPSQPGSALAAAALQRSDAIDMLRGVCVLLVTLHHIHIRFQFNRFGVNALLPKPIGQVLFWSGYFAVVTFFTISGFLITSVSLRRWGSLARIPLRQFYWLRFARIAPCLLLLVATLSVLHLARAPAFIIPPERASLARAALAALTFHVNWLEGQRGYLPGAWDVLWSLSVEEVFYLSFPVMCLLLRDARWLVVPLLVLIVIGPFNRVALAGRVPWADYAYLSCMDGIAFGCLGALLAARWRPRLSAMRALLAAGVAAVALVVVFRDHALSLGLQRLGLGVSVLELGVASMLIALSRGAESTLLTRGTVLLRQVGRSSYEIYLTHMLVILGLMPVITALNPRPAQTVASQMGGLQMGGLQVAASKPDAAWIFSWYALLLGSSVALGWLVHVLYSEPLNRALRSRSPSTAAKRATGAPRR